MYKNIFDIEHLILITLLIIPFPELQLSHRPNFVELLMLTSFEDCYNFKVRGLCN